MRRSFTFTPVSLSTFFPWDMALRILAAAGSDSIAWSVFFILSTLSAVIRRANSAKLIYEEGE